MWVNELREQIVACWNQEPNERPTAPKVLLALDEAKSQEPVVSAEDFGGETITREDELKDSTFWVGRADQSLTFG